MKILYKLRLNFFILPAIALLLAGCQTQSSESLKSAKTLVVPDQSKIMGQLKLTSPAFLDKGQIPIKYTCDGEDISPPLEINNVPEGAKSLALIVNDPDAPAGNWTHWLVWNIAPDIRQISENAAPPGARQGRTNFNQNKYGGPCPPAGAHRYQFKLYALDSQLDLGLNMRKKNLEQTMQGHILDQALLVGLYQRT